MKISCITSCITLCLRGLNYALYTLLAYSCIVMIYLLRPILGPVNICPLAKSGMHKLGCTQYALQQLKEQPFHRAWYNIITRLLTCHPLRSWQ